MFAMFFTLSDILVLGLPRPLLPISVPNSRSFVLLDVLVEFLVFIGSGNSRRGISKLGQVNGAREYFENVLQQLLINSISPRILGRQANCMLSILINVYFKSGNNFFAV